MVGKGRRLVGKGLPINKNMPQKGGPSLSIEERLNRYSVASARFAIKQ